MLLGSKLAVLRSSAHRASTLRPFAVFNSLSRINLPIEQLGTASRWPFIMAMIALYFLHESLMRVYKWFYYFLTIAPSLTLSMPCTNENGTMFGVSAVDISLSDVFSQLISLSYGQYSYAVVIDVKGIYHKMYFEVFNTSLREYILSVKPDEHQCKCIINKYSFQGRVWIHPRSPKPEESRLGPSLLPLQIYESWANKEIMKTILNQPSGHVKLNKVCTFLLNFCSDTG